RLTLVTNAMAREVTVDKAGRASGVAYVDKTTGADQHVRAKVVVLAASALETARLLLNSKSPAFPNGLANGSGTVGKYITDTTGTDVAGFIPKMMDHVPHNHDGVGGMHLYMPWWLEDQKLDFPRGYHIEVWGGTHQPSYGFMGGIQRYPSGGGYGRQLKDDYRRYYGATVGFSGRGEMIPNDGGAVVATIVVLELPAVAAAQGRLSSLLRRHRRVLGPRRDDSQRRHLLRDRPAHGGPLGHSGAAVPLEVVGPRVQAGEAHAGDVSSAHRRDGGRGVLPDAGPRAGIRHRGRRRHHP